MIRPFSGRAVRLVRTLDRHPVAVLCSAALGIVLGLAGWSVLQSSPILLARAGTEKRLHLFDQAGSISIGILGITFTVLAILTALPSTERTEELRSARAWGLLEQTLIVTAGFALLATVVAYLCSAIDTNQHGCELLEAILVGAMVAIGLGAVISGIAFALVLQWLRQKGGYHPPKGRGRGPA